MELWYLEYNEDRPEQIRADLAEIRATMAIVRFRLAKLR
jgi:hypothetical protein